MVAVIVFMFMITLLSFSAVDCTSMQKTSYKMPAICKGRTYCEYKGDDYPDEEHLVTLLEKSGMYDYIANFVRVAQRYGEDSQFQFECGGVQRGTPIYYIKDAYNVTRVVVQSDHPRYHYHQIYDIGRCESEGRVKNTKSLMAHELRALNAQFSCHNRYSTFDFHVLSVSNPDTLELVKADLPVCCKCEYERTGPRAVMMDF